MKNVQRAPLPAMHAVALQAPPSAPPDSDRVDTCGGGVTEARRRLVASLTTRGREPVRESELRIA
eukprot:2728417-Rhodomonas_salina.2